jgi:hypothetical protein
VMALEIALHELETFGLSRDPENYAFAVYGQQMPRPAGAGASKGTPCRCTLACLANTISPLCRSPSAPPRRGSTRYRWWPPARRLSAARQRRACQQAACPTAGRGPGQAVCRWL